VNFLDAWGLSASDPKNIPDSWIDNGNGTYTAQAGATLYGLYGSDWETKSGYEGDPTKLQIGQTVGTPNTQNTPNIPKTPTIPSWQEIQAGLPENQETIESSGYSRTTNVMIGIGEVIGGVGLWYLSYKAAEAVVVTGGTTSAQAGWVALETFAAGSTFIALGITRITDNNDTRIEDEIYGVIEPLIASVVSE